MQSARATHRSYQMSASKVREVLDLIRGQSVVKAMERLSLTDRGATEAVAKVLRSAAANASNLYGLPPEELFVSEAYANEGATLKRFRPRARGRAGRIRKRTSHIVIEVQRLPEQELRRLREKSRENAAGRRERRVRASRGERASDSSVTEVTRQEQEPTVNEAEPAVESSSAVVPEHQETYVQETKEVEAVIDGEEEKN